MFSDHNLDEPVLKVCSTCGQAKPLSEFHKKLDGLQPSCKACVRAYAKHRYYEHYDEVQEINSKSRQKHRKQRLEEQRQRYHEHSEEINAKKRQQYVENEEIRQRYKDNARQWAEDNPERKKANHKEWRKKNKDRINLYRQRMIGKDRGKYRKKWVINSARRRATVRNAIGNITLREWEYLKRLYEYTCLCCGKKEPEIKLTMDHVIPVSLGGANTMDNIQPLCGLCNSRKNDRVRDYRKRKYPPKQLRLL